MNQVKIGSLIAECRKEKNLTQMQLAEKLNITDRAVSKWETGKGMPDSSIMLALCSELGITVNDLLSGERLSINNYDKKAEENLLEMKKQQEIMARKMLLLEWVLIINTLLPSLALFILVGLKVIEGLPFQIGAIALGIFLIVIGVIFGIKIETEAGYYECRACKHRYVPAYKSVFMAMHYGRTRYMKCPECGKRTWQKKVIGKD